MLTADSDGPRVDANGNVPDDFAFLLLVQTHEILVILVDLNIFLQGKKVSDARQPQCAPQLTFCLDIIIQFAFLAGQVTGHCRFALCGSDACGVCRSCHRRSVSGVVGLVVGLVVSETTVQSARGE